jgi:hypothetical protein
MQAAFSADASAWTFDCATRAITPSDCAPVVGAAAGAFVSGSSIGPACTDKSLETMLGGAPPLPAAVTTTGAGGL